jgi:acyl carrier protein
MADQKIIDAIKTAAKNVNVELDMSENSFSQTLKSLNVDSLAAMGIIIEVEKTLKVRLPDEDLASLKTLGDLVHSFEKLVQ